LLIVDLPPALQRLIQWNVHAVFINYNVIVTTWLLILTYFRKMKHQKKIGK
jgi:hypothetical protein